MTDPLVVRLDAVAARHLALAIDVHGAWCRANGFPLPAAVTALRVTLAASAGHSRPNTTGAHDPGEDVPMPPARLFVTYDTAAERLAISVRSVRRLVAAGRLPVVTISGCPRIHVEDLADFAAGLREGASA